MAIVFNECDKVFTITTENTKYMFKVVADKYLVHCFYGAKHQKVDLSYNVQSLNFASPLEDSGIPRFTLNSTPAEFAYYGTGDYRCTSLRVRGKDGDSCTWYEYKGYEIIKGRVDIKGLPNARQLETTETLRLDLFDKVTGCNLSLYYSVYPSHDIITRYFTLENIGEASAKIEKAMSICLDLPGHDYEIISLHGCQTTECNVQRNPIYYGNYSIASRRGASSHEHNPFMALVEKGTNEETGNTYAFNLVYSGSFLDEVEVNSLGDTRVGIGVGEENFSYTVGVGETFYSPEGIMMFTPNGLGDMSRKMHSFIRDAILPKAVFEQRPIVLNTWESFYFDFDAKKVTELASAGNECGMDMLVLDDGWFGARTSEEQGLGDWYPNPERFPNGLKSFVDEIKSKNMKFGIWIEPEMVNPNSELYRKHPDWCLVCKGREGSLARNQLVLDLCNPDVMDYLKNSFEKTFEGIDIDYFKWDFNRNPSEAGSPYLPADMQEEVLYRYQLKVYELMQWFRDKYPNAEIESCSGGGGRYDLGMMAMSTMIWASDNTFAHDRLRIQNGISLAYPAISMSCHVSEPGKTENSKNILDYKYKVAIGGMLGYEFNLLDTCDEIKKQIKEQIRFFRDVEDIIKYGFLYRLVSPFENANEVSSYYYADKTQNADRVLLSYLQNFDYQKREISFLMDLTPQRVYTLKVVVADVNAEYIDKISGQKYSGAELRDGIQVRMSQTGQYGKLFLFEKVITD